MAIDFLILVLLIVSFITNLLALGAFWVTPGLRTTANRFTINLLIINLIGCLILAPTLFLSGDNDMIDSDANDTVFLNNSNSPLVSSFSASTNSDDSIEYYLKPGNHQMIIRHNGQLVEQEGIILQQRNLTNNASFGASVETIFKRNSTYYQQLTIDEAADTIVITEIEEPQLGESSDNASIPNITKLRERHSVRPPVMLRCWSIDLAAALGALSVLLVVGDTWCAITDPLRYHTRISGVKAWVLIALTWILGIFFGALSAFRELDFESETIFTKQKRFASVSSADSGPLVLWSSSSGIFSITFSCIYFVVIILLPFGFVCGMYWRIISEARENGLRMRQNGSSPLLQSALNLSTQQHQQQQHLLQQQQQQQQMSAYTNNLCMHRNSLCSASSLGGGLHMSIDLQCKRSPTCLRRDSAAKVLLPTISDDGCSDDADMESTNDTILNPVTEQNHSANRNQNVVLTLQAASGDIKRNYSARQLPLLGNSSEDFKGMHRLHGIRLVHSTPNLQKCDQIRRESLSDESIDPRLLCAEKSRRPYSHPPMRHVHHLPHLENTHRMHSHALQIPAINASPKALSYMSSLRHRLSNASSLFKYREESRAARISILVVIMFLVSYLPYGFLVLLQSSIGAANFVHSTQMAIFMLLLGNLSSPFIFAYRNKRVRRGVKRLCGMDAHTVERQLQRQNSPSMRVSGDGFLKRCNTTGNKTILGRIKRTASKASTYSTNSCKYLTAQPSIPCHGCDIKSSGSILSKNNNKGSSDVINGNCLNNAKNQRLLPATPTNVNTCHNNISNNNNNNKNSQCNNNYSDKINTEFLQLNNSKNSYLIATILNEKASAARGVRPILQRGITIVEHIHLPNSKLVEKGSIFKKFCQSSRSFSCASQSCAQGVGDNEPTAV